MPKNLVPKFLRTKSVPKLVPKLVPKFLVLSS